MSGKVKSNPRFGIGAKVRIICCEGHKEGVVKERYADGWYGIEVVCNIYAYPPRNLRVWREK